MPIVAVFLFGSRAREDHARGSDTDLLLVSESDEPRHVSSGHLSMFFYPWEKLIADARQGDLFACHIAHEAKPVFDPQNRLLKLQTAFQLRSSYRREIELATDLGWFLVRFGSAINPALLAKRILWCVRTVLIARSAEAGQPQFAPGKLAQLATSNAGQELLMRRHRRRADASMKRQFHRFLLHEVKIDEFHNSATRDEFISRFGATTNLVALQTLCQEEKSRSGYM
jgi:hypothetical protein